MYVLNDIKDPERTSTSRGSTILMSQCCRITDDSKGCCGNNWTIFKICFSIVPTSFLVLIVQTSGVTTPMVWVYLLFLCYFFLLSFLWRMYWNSLLLIPNMGRTTLPSMTVFAGDPLILCTRWEFRGFPLPFLVVSFWILHQFSPSCTMGVD